MRTVEVSSDQASSHVMLCEMSARDGMQILNESRSIRLDDRLRLIELLIEAGFGYIEVGSYVHPKTIPAMADTPELVARLTQPEGFQLAALVPNERGYEAFRKVGKLNTVALFLSADEEYSLKNTKMSLVQALDGAIEVARRAKIDGYNLRAHLSAGFRYLSPQKSDAPPIEDRVLSICKKLLDLKCDVVALADTDGRARRDEVEKVLEHLIEKGIPRRSLGVHLHDRYGLAMLNADAAFKKGIRIFDCAVGGIGGNPSVKGAVGNISTLELIQYFHDQNVETGIDVAKVIDAGELITQMTRTVGFSPPPCKYLRGRLAERDG